MPAVALAALVALAAATSRFLWIAGGIAVLAFICFAIKYPRAAMFVMWALFNSRRRCSRRLVSAGGTCHAPLGACAPKT